MFARLSNVGVMTLIATACVSVLVFAQGRPFRSPTFPTPAPAAAISCLHDAGELPEQAARRRQALTAARMINTAQAQQRSATGVYLDIEALLNRPALAQLATGQRNEIASGWQLSIATTPDGYLFALKDTTDPCHFAYFSDENGVIYTGQPIQ